MIDLELGAYVPYLLNRAGTRIAAAFTEELRRHGITLQVWRVLAALHHEGGQRMGRLSRLTSIEVSTLSRLVRKMERQGLARRSRPGTADDGADARAVTVRRTEAGEALTERIIPLALHYEAVATAGFTPEEAAQLRRFLVRLYENMAELEDGHAEVDDASVPAPSNGGSAARETRG